MNKVNITDKGILEYYGNRVGFVKNDTAYVDEMFRKKDIEEFLSGENGLNIEWRNDIYDRLVQGNVEVSESLTVKRCRLYQLKAATDIRMRFIGYDELKDRGFAEPNIDDYRVVYDGSMGTNNLEEIYAKFDAQEKPKDFEESGIYISDVIELYDDETNEFYYVNTQGFRRLDDFTKPKFEVNRQQTKENESVPEKEPKGADRTVPKPKKEPETIEPTQDAEETFQVETFRITM